MTYISWLISWRPFDGGILDWRYWPSVTLSLTYKYICRSVTYILWYSDSALYFQYHLMNKPHSLDIGSDMGHWPVFHDKVFLNPLPISAYGGVLKFDMKIFVNVARLEIDHLFTQGTLDTFLVDWIIIKLTGNQESHKISDEFEFRPHQTLIRFCLNFEVMCPWAREKIFRTWSLWNLLVTRADINTINTSLISGQIGVFALELLTL